MDAVALGVGIGIGISVFEVLRASAARLLARRQVFTTTPSTELTSRECCALEQLSSDLHTLTTRLSHTCDRVETWLDLAADPVDSDEIEYSTPKRGPHSKLIETFYADPQLPNINTTLDNDAGSGSDALSSLEDLFAEYDRLEEADGGNNRTLRHKTLDEILSRQDEILARNESSGMWHLAAAYFHKATKGGELIDGPGSANISEEEKVKMRADLEVGLEFAKSAGDDCWQGHKWIAIFTGVLSKFDPIKEKILRAHEYKKHILRAIELNPNDPSCHYLYGRWSFEVNIFSRSNTVALKKFLLSFFFQANRSVTKTYNIIHIDQVAGTSWWTRKAAAALFAEVPSASYEDCLREFNEAHRVANGTFWRSNYVYIAKCYVKLEEADKARSWLEKAIAKPITGSLDDQKYLKKAQDMLRELS